MDRIIYTAMNGAARIAEHQTVLGNNMANVNTPGFREQIALYRSGAHGRRHLAAHLVSTRMSTPGNNFEMGNMMTTGRELDGRWPGRVGSRCRRRRARPIPAPAPLQGRQRPAADRDRQPVLSDQNAVIEVPDQASLTIASDGTVTAIGAGDPPNNILNLGRLKMVNLPPSSWRMATTGVPVCRRSPAASPSRRCRPIRRSVSLSGVLEGSNASPMGAMEGMIQNARRFEMQMQVIREADKNAERANGILAAAS